MISKTAKVDIVREARDQALEERRRRMVMSFRAHFANTLCVKSACAFVAKEEHLSWWSVYNIVKGRR